MNDIELNDLDLDPGPKDPSVLHLQAEHRSTNVWKAGGGYCQRSRVRNKYPPVHARMIPYLKDVQFDGVARLTGIQIDWSLITALVERWRPETHTFHLPIGESTVTLQDVNVILGLRIDGPAISGSTEFNGGWVNAVKDMFGKAPTKEKIAGKYDDSRDLVGGRLKLSWLDRNFPKLPDNADDDELLKYTHAYMLHLLGGVLFTDHQGSQVHCMFIPLIQNFERCSKLSWGSAVLAFLYRELCKACKIGTEEISGCVLLLQLWAWTRLPTLAPVPRGICLDHQQIWGDLPGPFGLRWCARKSFTDVSSHVVSVDRLSLDVITPNHFVWLPYDNILDELSKHCTKDRAIWCYKGPLIFFHIVEPHQPDRVVRQFGMVQDVPPPPSVYSRDLHKINLRGKTDVNWQEKHYEHINCWNNREQHIYGLDNFGDRVTDDYVKWYASITRPYHTRIAAAQSHLFKVLDHISLIARGEITGDMSKIDALSTHARRILEHQYSHGLNQDFLCDDRLGKEELVRGKPKRIGHKGGRGGVNAPKRRAIDMDDGSIGHVNEEGSVHLGDNDGAHSVNDVEISKSPYNVCVGEKSAYIVNDEMTRDAEKTRNVDPSPPSTIPNNESMSPSDFQWPRAHQQSDYVEGIRNVDHTPSLSHPTFELMSPSYFQWPAHQQPELNEEVRNVDEISEDIRNIYQTPPLSHPIFELPSPSDIQWPPAQQLLQQTIDPHISIQEEPDQEQEQQLHVEQEQQPHQVQEQQPKVKMVGQ